MSVVYSFHDARDFPLEFSLELGFRSRLWFQMLLKAMRAVPNDSRILYNIAVVLQQLGSQNLRDEKSTLKTALRAVSELGIAYKFFSTLSQMKDTKHDTRQAKLEARKCSDLLNQAQYHVARARKLDEEEAQHRLRQERERRELLAKLEAESLKVEKRKQQEREELIAKRKRFLEDSKDKTKLHDVPKSTPGRRKKSRNDALGSMDAHESSGGRNGTGRKRKRTLELSRKKVGEVCIVLKKLWNRNRINITHS